MMPAWDNFAAAAAKQQLPLNVVKVNVADAPDKVPASVKGFPTVIFTGAGGAKVYDGDRSADDLMKFSVANLPTSLIG